MTRADRLYARTEQARAAWLLSCDTAARHVGVDLREVVKTRGVKGRGSTDAVTRARRFACYLATVVANADHAALARAAGMDRKTLRLHCEWVEDRREDPANPGFEGLVSDMEAAIFGAALRIVAARLGASGDVAEAA